LKFTQDGFLELAKTVKTIATAEGLEAHGKSVTVREGYKTGKIE
jgi:histidinol dehydrogenase